jgi:hypothetical protein
MRLDGFLAAPDVAAARFAISKPRREHLVARLRSAITGVAVRTEKSGIPYQLVVVKIEEEGSGEGWRRRCEEAERSIRALGKEEQLRMVLGWKFEELVTLKAVRPAAVDPLAAWAMAPERQAVCSSG